MEQPFFSWGELAEQKAAKSWGSKVLACLIRALGKQSELGERKESVAFPLLIQMQVPKAMKVKL